MTGAQLAELVAETGDHPLNGAFCPGRHRAPWTLDRVRTDAMAGLRLGVPGPRGAHRQGRTRLLTLAELLTADALVDQVLRAQLGIVHVDERRLGGVYHAVDAGAR